MNCIGVATLVAAISVTTVSARAASSEEYKGPIIFVWTLRKVGINHILFGSDWPVYTPDEAVKAARHLGLTEAEQKEILHDNASALLGLQDK